MTTTRLIDDPSLNGPSFHFGTGAVVNNAAELSPEAGETATPATDWKVIQWHMDDYISPIPVVVPSVTAGHDSYLWSNANGSATLSAHTANDGSWIYGLEDNNNWNGANDGGANLLLSADVSPTTMDHTVNYSLDLRITDAAVDPSANAFLNTGFTVNFHDPSGSASNMTLFLQIPITHSGGEASTDYYSNSGGVAIAQGLLEGSSDTYFQFSPETQTQHVQYSSINLYLQQAIQKLGLSPAMSNMADWTLGSVYVGTEGSGNPGTTAKVGVELSHILLTETDGSPAEQVPTDPSQFDGAASDFDVTLNGNSFTVDLKGVQGSARSLADGSSPHFSDGTAMADPTGAAAHLIPFFEAAFGRLPSAGELKSVMSGAGTTTSDTTLGSEFLSLSGLAGPTGVLSGFGIIQMYHNLFGAYAPMTYITAAANAATTSAASGALVASLATSSQAQAGVVGHVAAAGDAISNQIGGISLLAFGEVNTSLVSAFRAVVSIGVTLQAVAQTFVSATSLNTASNSGFVAEVFEHLRGATPDQQTSSTWTTILNAGLSRADALVAIGTSPETLNHLNSGSNGGWVLAHS